MDNTDWVAIYGAVVATIFAFIQVFDVGICWQSKRPRIRVTSSWAMSTHAPGKTFVGITAANLGEQSVMLNTFVVRMPDGKQLHFRDLYSHPPLPAEIPPQRTCEVLVEREELVPALREGGYGGKAKLQFEFRDEVGNRHRSERLPFDAGDENDVSASVSSR